MMAHADMAMVWACCNRESYNACTGKKREGHGPCVRPMSSSGNPSFPCPCHLHPVGKQAHRHRMLGSWMLGTKRPCSSSGVRNMRALPRLASNRCRMNRADQKHKGCPPSLSDLLFYSAFSSSSASRLCLSFNPENSSWESLLFHFPLFRLLSSPFAPTSHHDK
jgi:hypothetical protein